MFMCTGNQSVSHAAALCQDSQEMMRSQDEETKSNEILSSPVKKSSGEGLLLLCC